MMAKCLLIPTVVVGQSTNPETFIENQETEANEKIDTWFDFNPLDSLLKPVEIFRENLSEKQGIDFSVLLSPIYQVGPDSSTLNLAIDVFARWEKVVDGGNGNQGSINFLFSHRSDSLIGTDTNQFQEQLGLLLPVNDAEVEGTLNALQFLAWEQLLFNQKLDITIGQLDPESLFDENNFAGSDRESFIHRTLSANPVRAFSNPGLGVNLNVYPVPELRLAYGLIDGDGDGRYPDFSTVGNGRWSQIGEIAYMPNLENLGQGHYRLGIQYIDSAEKNPVDNPASTTWSMSFDQEIGESFGVFLRYANGDGKRTNVKEFVSFGGVWREAFGKNNDWLGLGLFWGSPSENTEIPDPRNEFGGELFWRMQLNKRTQFTSDLMLIRPSNHNQGNGLEAIFNVRFSYIF
ncbi:carbohydrate porin [Synechocystis salina LEGE 06155]|nr:carbohydrate porin [Synechocystis salina LEGE 06155]